MVLSVKVVCRFVFGPHFQKLIDSIYKEQKAIAVVEGHKTNEIKIKQGVRQCSPLSPLMFALGLSKVHWLLSDLEEEDDVGRIKL